MLEKLTPAPWGRIAGYYRLYLAEDPRPGIGRIGWIMRASKGTLNPASVMAFVKGWDLYVSGKPEPDLKECDAVRYGYAEASR